MIIEENVDNREMFYLKDNKLSDILNPQKYSCGQVTAL